MTEALLIAGGVIVALLIIAYLMREKPSKPQIPSTRSWEKQCTE